MAPRRKPKDIDEYISAFPPEVRAKLESLRKAIRDAAPGATEAIAYGIPTFRLNGNLVHFAAYKGHIGFYPASSGMEAFSKELAKYDVSRGTVRFPIDEEPPLKLVARIVRFRVKENSAGE